MQELLLWSQTNNGFLMLLLTFVYVIATFILAWLSWKSIQQTASLELARSRPYLTFQFNFQKNVVNAVIKNVGKTGAYNISLSLSPQVLVVFGQLPHSETALTSQNISFLAPGNILSDLIATGPQFFVAYDPPNFKGQIKYHDLSGNEYLEPIETDLTYMTKISYLDDPDVGTQLKKMEKSLGDIADAVVKIQRHLK